jgi:hypothetical protein
MLAIGLFGVALALFRDWLGDFNRFAFLGLLGCVVLVSWTIWFVASGAVQRFSAGFGAVASGAWCLVLAAPGPILNLDRDWVVLPVARWCHPEPSGGPSRLEWMFQGADGGGNCVLIARRGKTGPVTATSHRAHIYDGLYDLQAYLLIPMVVLATLVGSIGVGIRPKSPILPSPNLRP